MTLKRFKLNTLVVALSFATFLLSKFLSADEPSTQSTSRPLILVHYMPWYEIRPTSPRWGWHWTMNHFDPEKQSAGKRQIASHFYPLIGPYDSSDVAVIDYHLQTMKRAGIDGVIVDWYGLTDYRDYPVLHRATTRLLEQCEKLQMKFIICYEDQTIPALIDARRLKPDDRVSHAVKEITWLGKYWFKSPSYVRLDGKPVMLSFGQTGLTDEEWSSCLNELPFGLTYFSQHHRRTAAVGAFDWPVPKEGLKAFERFHIKSQNWSQALPCAFPRFVDIYAEAKVGPSYGQLADDKGMTFEKTLEMSLMSKCAIVQIATWNDWGEGTQIEPSIEFGFRDLETIQRLRKKLIDPTFSSGPNDLKSTLFKFEQRIKGGFKKGIDGEYR